MNELLTYRKKFQKAKSPTEICILYHEVLDKFKSRYKTLYYWESERLKDVINRRDFLLSNCKGRILDIGCSDGMFDIRLAENGFDVTGIDMIKSRINLANSKIKEGMKCRFICDMIENINPDLGNFDTLILSHVLEHAFDPERILSIAAGMVKKDGKIIIILPPGIGNDPTHLRFIPTREIKKMLGKYGKVSNKIIISDKSSVFICEKI